MEDDLYTTKFSQVKPNKLSKYLLLETNPPHIFLWIP